MLDYFLKRLLAIVPKLLIITILIFFGLELIPGDVLTRSIDPELLRGMNQEQLEEIREEKGLNDPAPVRYVQWLANLFKGDMGYSTVSGTPIGELLAVRIPATLEICLLGTLIAGILGILLGSSSARRKNTIVDYGNTTMGMIGTSVPEFFFGMCFIMLFSIKLGWLPTGGRMSVGQTGFFQRINHMIMPAFCLAIALIAYLMRLTRNSMLDVINKDYVKTARAKGAGETTIFYKHCFRNGCTPVLIVLISRLSMLISGTAVIETIFNYPGMGLLLITSINTKDMSVAMMILLLASVFVLITSFLTDIVTALLDPRIRFDKEGQT